MRFPIFIENSRIPVILSKVAPIDIYAISLGPFIICRSTMGERTKNHESIHFRQWLELGFVLFPIMYSLYWLRNKINGMDGFESYRMIPFEVEAYDNEGDLDYLSKRKHYAWWR